MKIHLIDGANELFRLEPVVHSNNSVSFYFYTLTDIRR
jgi:hypothetical protein